MTFEELEHKYYYNEELNIKNENSFKKEFPELLSKGFGYVLIAVNVNLEKINALSRKLGDELLKDCSDIFKKHFSYCYHIHGEKFNIVMNDYEYNDAVMASIELEIDDLVEKKIPEENDVDITLYYGVSETKTELLPSIDDVINQNDYSYNIKNFILLTVEKMYADKKLKRPKNPDILRMEKENERLMELLNENKDIALKFRKSNHTAIFEQNKKVMKDFFDNYRKVKKAKELSKSNIVAEDCIPMTDKEAGILLETDENKFIDTMWWEKITIKYTKYNEYHNLTLLIYPLEYVKAPATVPILVIAYDSLNRTFETGTKVEINAGATKFGITARFTMDGNFNITFEVLDDNITILEKNVDNHKGICTPINFGKAYKNAVLYPIDENSNGCLNCIIYNKNKKKGFLSNGIIDTKYNFIRNGNNLSLVSIK